MNASSSPSCSRSSSSSAGPRPGRDDGKLACVVVSVVRARSATSAAFAFATCTVVGARSGTTIGNALMIRRDSTRSRAGVVAVCGLAPWLEGSDPVDQLAGRSVLIAHGDRERMTDPAASYAYALRARSVTDRVARFDVLGDGHAMLRRAGDWTALVRRFALGELGAEPRDPVIANAMAEPAPAGLRVALEGVDR